MGMTKKGTGGVDPTVPAVVQKRVFVIPSSGDSSLEGVGGGDFMSELDFLSEVGADHRDPPLPREVTQEISDCLSDLEYASAISDQKDPSPLEYILPGLYPPLKCPYGLVMIQ